LRTLRASIVIVIVLLTAQGWTGDFSNLFATFPTGHVAFAMGGFLQAVSASGMLVVFHAIEGALLIVLAFVVLALSSVHKIARGFALLGALAVVSAAVGGILFVFSGFQNNANSAQMGGSFIGAYAFYFLALYSTKR
jgi:hypothetical protein